MNGKDDGGVVGDVVTNPVPSGYIRLHVTIL